MERIVVAHFHHSTTEVPLHVGNRFHAEKRCSPCPSHAFSFHRCVGNGAITPVWGCQMTICARICSGMCTSPSRLAWINGAQSRLWPSSSRALRKSWESSKAVISLRVLGRIPSIVSHAIDGPRQGFARRRRVTMISRCCNLSLDRCESSAQAWTACDLPRRSEQELAGDVVKREHARKGCPTNRYFPAITLPSCLWTSVGIRSEKGASGATLRWALLRSRMVVPWF